MPSKGGYTEAPPRYGGDRFCNPPAALRNQQIILPQDLIHRQLLPQQQQQQQQHHHHQQQQQQRQFQGRAAIVRPESSATAAARVKRKDAGGDSSKAVALSIPRSIIAASTLKETNLDRLMESVSPFVQARFFSSEVNARGSRMREVDSRPFFYLEDLWESFDERSAYGVGVPLLLNGKDPTEQFYVPFLSGIQLYIDPSKSSSRNSVINEESDAESYRLTSSAGSSNPNMQHFNNLSLGDQSVISSSNSEADIAKLPLKPVFSFLEREQPHNRRPLADKIYLLASEYPDLGKLRSCDLHPTSWICVAWYPIYRIPMGSTLRDLDASFLSFHSLSTQPRSNCPPQFHAPNTRRVKDIVDPAPRISLPVFALAAYKLKGSIVSPIGPHEREQENSLQQAADSWLRYLKVMLPDYNFFRTHSERKR